MRAYYMLDTGLGAFHFLPPVLRRVFRNLCLETAIAVKIAQGLDVDQIGFQSKQFSLSDRSHLLPLSPSLTMFQEHISPCQLQFYLLAFVPAFLVAESLLSDVHMAQSFSLFGFLFSLIVKSFWTTPYKILSPPSALPVPLPGFIFLLNIYHHLTQYVCLFIVCLYLPHPAPSRM